MALGRVDRDLVGVAGLKTMIGHVYPDQCIQRFIVLTTLTWEKEHTLLYPDMIIGQTFKLCSIFWLDNELNIGSAWRLTQSDPIRAKSGEQRVRADIPKQAVDKWSYIYFTIPSLFCKVSQLQLTTLLTLNLVMYWALVRRDEIGPKISDGQARAHNVAIVTAGSDN